MVTTGFFFAVQLCWKNSRSTWIDSKAAGTRNKMQDYGQRKGINEGSKKSLLNFYFNTMLFSKSSCKL